MDQHRKQDARLRELENRCLPMIGSFFFALLAVSAAAIILNSLIAFHEGVM